MTPSCVGPVIKPVLEHLQALFRTGFLPQQRGIVFEGWFSWQIQAISTSTVPEIIHPLRCIPIPVWEK